mmetsp:Transcript_19232/g.35276  ORF Transcript_19232/g.35276 Transcript_19232/m.35276 type:complete len:250 (+) Transcript_19232:1027-1776(+)
MILIAPNAGTDQFWCKFQMELQFFCMYAASTRQLQAVSPLIHFIDLMEDSEWSKTSLKPSLVKESKIKPGRKPSFISMLLSNFRTRRDAVPRLEYMRAFLIRFEKKIIRTILRRGCFSSYLRTKFESNPDILLIAQDIVEQHSSDLTLQASVWSTDFDPVKKCQHKSFNKQLAEGFYDNHLVVKLHDIIIAAVFDSDDIHEIEEFFKITYLPGPSEAQKVDTVAKLRSFFLSNLYYSKISCKKPVASDF